MADNLAPILVSITALIAVGIIFAIARRIFTGQLTPLDVRDLIQRNEEQIHELRRQNDMLRDARDKDQAQLQDTLREATKAIFSVTSWLVRYEDRGGFASPVVVKPQHKAQAAQE